MLNQLIILIFYKIFNFTFFYLSKVNIRTLLIHLFNFQFYQLSQIKLITLFAIHYINLLHHSRRQKYLNYLFNLTNTIASPLIIQKLNLFFSFQSFQKNCMNTSKLTTPKSQHYNRFSYLLEPSQGQQKIISQKEVKPFSINPCGDDPCNFNNISTEVKEEVLASRLDQQLRKPLKYQLQSQNYEIFKQKISHKSSLNSFLAYTPQRSLDKDDYSIYNVISTIEYAKSNEIHTHRNLFESILDEGASVAAEIQQENIGLICRHQQIQPKKKPIILISKTKKLQNQLIKLQLSQSDDEEPQKYDHTFPKKHLRTLTEGAYDDREYNISTVQKSFRFTHYIRKSQLKSVGASEPSKDYSLESTLINQVLKPKKSSKITIATLKTKQMSQKLQESSELSFHNSISLTPLNSKAPSFKKTIILGRRTANKI